VFERFTERARQVIVLAQDEIESEIGAIVPPVDLPPSARDADAERWQYEVKRLEGASDGWAEQLAEWRRDGWELLTVVSDGDARHAILERRV